MATNVSTIKIKAIRRQSRNATGLAPILIKLIGPNNERKFITTNILCKENEFDTKACIIKQNIANSHNYNVEINKTISRLHDIINELAIKKIKPTPAILIDVFNNKNSIQDKTDFIIFSKQELHNTRKNYSLDHYSNLRMYIDKFAEYTHGSIQFDAITPFFLQQFEYYLKHELKLKTNSIYQFLSTLRKMFNAAITQNLTTHYPFKVYKLKKEIVDIEYLTIEELEIFQNLLDSNTLSKKLQKTLFHFLLSSYTGFRKNDERKIVLDIDKYIIDGAIVFKTKKTKKLVRIPINPKALKLIEITTQPDFETKIGYLKQKSERITNDLTEIIAIAKIRPRKLTFHCSRHTFATTCLSYGIPIEFISEWLGHEDIKTTQRYSKINLKVAAEQMSKWQ